MNINKIPFLLFFISLVLPVQFSYGQDSVAISEFMAINTDNLQDEDGDYSDWIEIHNAGSSEISLYGWFLTDEADSPAKWAFPDITIDANEYIVVFASGKDRKSEKDKLHTNFKLSGPGEYLALVKPGGTLLASAFSPAYPEQFQNISYGKNASGYSHFSDPTPGAENTGSIYISPPKFNVAHGFFQDAFNLELYNSQMEGIDIYYTTDAGTPDKTKGIRYSEPIPVSTTTVIRAIAVKEGVGESVSATQSYIFPTAILQQSEDQPGYPATWLSPIHGTDEYFEIPSNYSMKSAFIEMPEVGKVILQSLKSLPVVSIVSDADIFFSKSMHPDSGGIYMYNGEPDGPTRNLQYHLGHGWTRPASVEYFNTGAGDGSIDFQANCAVKIHGGATRTRAKTEKHSFKIGFKPEYGPSKLEAQLFGKDSPSQYDWLVLRGGFAPRLGQQIRDPWAKSTLIGMGQYAARSKFVHVYINGLYWGMYNLSERMDENCMRDNLGGSADDYDIVKDYYEIETGDTVAWNKLVTMAADNIENPENYQKILGKNPDGTPNPSYEKMVDPENLIDYILMNMYAGTGDWDNHNWAAARRKTDSEGFHFLVWDAEGVFGGNNVSGIISGGAQNRPTGIFSDLMRNEQFKNHLISRVNRHFFEGGALTPSPCLARYEKWLDEIDTALISDQARWVGNNDIWNTGYHAFIYNYFPPRTENVFNQFITTGIYPDIDVPEFNTENKIIPEDFQIMMTSPLGGEIRYTLDGTDPGHFSLSGSKSIIVYDNQVIPLDGDTTTIYARVKKDTLWSRLVTRQFIVDNVSSSFTEGLSGYDSYLYSYPNPAKDFTRIVFSLSEPSDISIKIYTVLGIEAATVVNEFSQAGEHTITWDTGNLSPGVYFCVLENHTKTTYTRISLIKE
jgi:hypothetical protein